MAELLLQDHLRSDGVQGATWWLGRCVRHYSEFNFCGDNGVHCLTRHGRWHVPLNITTSYTLCWRRYSACQLHVRQWSMFSAVVA